MNKITTLDFFSPFLDAYCSSWVSLILFIYVVFNFKCNRFQRKKQNKTRSEEREGLYSLCLI
jgi:hypothetical protein